MASPRLWLRKASSFRHRLPQSSDDRPNFPKKIETFPENPKPLHHTTTLTNSSRAFCTIFNKFLLRLVVILEGQASEVFGFEAVLGGMGFVDFARSGHVLEMGGIGFFSSVSTINLYPSPEHHTLQL
ncbi:hypothetical protein Pyn_34817 [Prunus yedoensis var. nudiflora]|uniref:Uncharacterized protein n=1 Tax=Prunus yedoensis var. nudiflora TaxID=2094558 RepID=A0A314ZFF1_PRUYE|nr:hypothetical protein Pyn_34817 [Prunus yedoensis var. nudiflora]